MRLRSMLLLLLLVLVVLQHQWGDAFVFRPSHQQPLGTTSFSSLLGKNIFCISRVNNDYSSNTVNNNNIHNYVLPRGTTKLSSKPWSPSSRPSPFSSSSSTTTLSASIDPAVAMASLGATAKLLSSIGFGSWAAHGNILDANAISVLSKLVYWIFQPAFLLTSVCKTLHSASTAGSTSAGALAPALLALMPLTALIQVLLGTVVGRIVTQAIQIENVDERKDVIMCTTFGNSGPLPLLFSDALFSSRAAAAVSSDVAACISFYLLMWSPLFWSFGKLILGTTSTNTSTSLDTWKTKLQAQIKLFLSPPVIGALLGLFIGLVAPLRKAFMGGILSPVFGALTTLGTAYLPAAMLVLAGSLVGKKPETFSPTPSTVTPPKSTGTSLKAIFAILLSRFCVAPLLALGVVHTLTKWQIIGPVGTRARAIVTFTLLMEGCMPPAQNSVILLQLEGLRDRAQRMAKTLTITYSLAVVPVAILLSACLGLSGILKFV